MPVWEIHHADRLERCMGCALRDIKWETFHVDGERIPGVHSLYLDLGKWISIFDDAGAWFIYEALLGSNHAIDEGTVHLDWRIHDLEELAPSLKGVLGKRLIGSGPSPDKEEFQLFFEGGAMIALSSGKLAEGGGADEGFNVSFRP